MSLREGMILAAFGVVFYTYLGYPFLLWVLSRFKPREKKQAPYTPAATVLIAAHNEEKWIEPTLRSLLNSDYPADLLDIVVVSDASTDRTEEMVRSLHDPRVRWHQMPRRGGKTKALREGVHQTNRDFIVLADASSLFAPSAVRNLLRHFQDPRVGSVVGRKGILRTGTSLAAAEGSYWHYDALLREWESRTGGSWVGCEGTITAVRKSNYDLDFGDDLAEDYSMCCRIYERGLINRFDSQAVAFEASAQDMLMEYRRRIRVCVRGIRALFAFGYLLNPIKHPAYFWQNISHRLLRWIVPVLLVFILGASAGAPSPWIQGLFYSQIIFYGFAGLGILFKWRGRPFYRWAAFPAYFVTLNGAALVSWFLVARKYGVWDRTEHESVGPVRTPKDGNLG